jgi:molybdate transport system ATP-binding protein
MSSSDNIAADRSLLDVRVRFSRATGRQQFQLDAAFQVPAGISILFGPSGAGKSTLLDCVSGLLRPSDARITLQDTILQDSGAGAFLPPRDRHIAYLFQSPALFPHLTVQQNAEFGLRGTHDARHYEGQSQKKDTPANLLKMFRVAHLSEHKAGEISGGEAQRVALARALATSPRAVLLDEPLKGLDADLKSSIVDDLRSWNRAHSVPILYVTHHRDEVDALGERVIALDHGRVVNCGVPHAVLDAPRTKRLARASGFENFVSAQILELREADGVMRARLDGSHTELELPLGYAAAGNRVRVAIRAGDILLASQRPAGLSARNILEGTVESIEVRGPTVVCRVNAGVAFQVHITPGALRSLELTAGSRAWLVIKTHSCQLVDD